MKREQRLRFGNTASLGALRCFCLFFCACFLGGIGGLYADESPDHVHDHIQVRIILSTGALTDINVNDATAAFRVWLRELGRRLNVPVTKDAMILSSLQEIARELDRHSNHLVSLSLPEYLSFDAERFTRSIYLTKSGSDGSAGHRYFLLVRENGPIQELGDLRGKKLVHYENRETTMAQDWLEYQLAEAGQVGSTELLKSYTKDSDLSKSVLGVFFGKVDACLVSDRSFDLLCELNPQLRLKLKVLAKSPVIVSGAMFTQMGYDSQLEIQISRSLEMLGDDVAGKQILTMFRTDSVYHADISDLQDSIDLYKKWTRGRGREE